MAVTFTDDEIDALIKERKLLPANWRNLTRLKPKRGHDERNLELTGAAGNRFCLILRKSRKNPLDFSVILAVRIPKSNRLFRLRRYNGKSHAHTNRIERQTFRGFHIHTATERYQERGDNEDDYAESTDRYGDFQGAWGCLASDANLVALSDTQTDIFTQEVE